MDLRLKNYSSGMLVRLAFATAIQVDAEILLIDEVLAVGDAAFQQKCFEEFFRLKREGRTIVFVSHDMHSVERFCDRAMLMERGEMVEDRRPARDRPRLPRAQLRPARPRRARGEPLSASGTAIAEAWFENADGERVDERQPGGAADACASRRSIGEDAARPGVRGHAAHRARPHDHRRPLGPARTRERLVQGRREASSRASPIPNWLTPSRYLLTPSLAREGTGEDGARAGRGHGLDRGPRQRRTGGILELPVDVTLERA